MRGKVEGEWGGVSIVFWPRAGDYAFLGPRIAIVHLILNHHLSTNGNLWYLSTVREEHRRWVPGLVGLQVDSVWDLAEFCWNWLRECNIIDWSWVSRESWVVIYCSIPTA